MATEVIIPALGVITEKVKILTWFKSEGDPVQAGEPLFEVESDKVTTEIPSPASGILGTVLYGEGQEVGITKVVAIILENGEAAPEVSRKPPAVESTLAPSHLPGTLSSVGKAPESVKVVPAARKLAEKKGVDLYRVTPTGPHGTVMKKDVEAYLASLGSGELLEEKAPRASSLARKIAMDLAVPLAKVEGSGPGGRIMKADVLTAAGRKPSVPETSSLSGKAIPMSTMRKVIARRLSESAFTAPHIHLFMDVNMREVLQLREAIVEDFERRFNVRISINDFLIKAVALAIREFPWFNASVKGDEIEIHPDINVGLAVALEDGLIVPAIGRADQMGLGAIAHQRSQLVEKAKAGKLTRDEIERGTFTITSLAGFDIRFFTAIINPPQSGILSVGKVEEELYLQEGQVKVRTICHLGLSADHRIIDGAVAARFLGTIKKILENPTFHFLNL